MLDVGVSGTCEVVVLLLRDLLAAGSSGNEMSSKTLQTIKLFKKWAYLFLEETACCSMLSAFAEAEFLGLACRL